MICFLIFSDSQPAQERFGKPSLGLSAGVPNDAILNLLAEPRRKQGMPVFAGVPWKGWFERQPTGKPPILGIPDSDTYPKTVGDATIMVVA